MNGYERETYEQATALLPEVDIFGWLRFHSALLGALRPDRHPDAYEIHYLRNGHLYWWVEKEAFEFNPGSVFVVRPNELHGGEEDALQPCEHYWLRLKFPAGGAAIPGLTVRDTARLYDGFESLEHRTFQVSSAVRDGFARLLQEHRNPMIANAALMARVTLHALLILILRDHDQACSGRLSVSPLSWRVRRAREWVDRQLGTASLNLEELSASLRISASGLRQRFKVETGETVHDYWLRQRLAEAERRLTQSDEDVVGIAYALGFSSSQYFSTFFRKQTGFSPCEFRDRRAKR